MTTTPTPSIYGLTPSAAFAWLLVAVLGFLPINMPASSAQANVGGVTIETPALDGFYEVSEIAPDVRKLSETMVPPTNRLLGVYVSHNDYQRILDGEYPEFDRYIFLQVGRDLERKNISQKGFRKLSGYLKTQQEEILEAVESRVDKLFENTSEKLSEDYDVSFNMKVGEQVPVGVFLEHPNALGFVTLVKYQGNLDGEKLDYVVAGGTLVLKIKRRLLYAYVYSTYEKQEDIDWVRSESTALADLLLTSNNATEPEDEPAVSLSIPDFDWDGIMRSSMIGAGAGIAVAVIYLVFLGIKNLTGKGRRDA
jgi:hypothetical protein